MAAVWTLLVIARGHVVNCRRDVPSVLMTLRVECAGQDHRVGRAIAELIDELKADCVGRIAAGRSSGAIPPGPPPQVVASAYLGVLESLGVQLAGHAPHDVVLVDRAVRGLLGLPPAALPQPAMEAYSGG